MNDFTTSAAMWLADYFLLSTVLLLLTLTALAALKQPAQRLAVTKSTLVALFLLATFCSLPGWSIVHLLSAEQPRANGSPVAARNLEAINERTPIIASPIDTEIQTRPAPPTDALGPAPPREAFWTTLTWPTILTSLYAAGSLTVLAWLSLGSIAAHRLVQSATPAPDPLSTLITELAGSQRRPARLLLSTKIDVAVAIGIRHPAILLPQHLAHAHSQLPVSRSLLRAPCSPLLTILAHELAHITGHDLHWLAASRALLVLLWPQPLFWLLRRRMRLDQEALADAAAAELTNRQTYAEQLVAWARKLPPHPAPRLSAAVGLWEGPSQLRQRIALLLDEHFTVLRNCSRRWRLSALTLAVVATLALSIVTLQPTPDAAAQPAEQVATETVTPPTNTPATPTPEIPRPVPNTILGRTVDENGRPIAGAEVFLFRVNRQDFTRKLLAQKATDAGGNFRFERVIDIEKEFPGHKYPPLDVLGDELVQTIVRAPGKVSDARTQLPQQIAQRGDAQIFKMPPAATLRGRVTGPDGKPVAGALVSTSSGWFGNWEGAQSVRTDADGNYVIDDVAPFDIEKYRQQQEEQRRQMEAKSRAGEAADWLFFAPPTLTVEHPGFAVKKTGYERIPGTKDVQLEPAAILEGRVVYGDTGQPAADVLVQAATSNPRGILPSMDAIYKRHAAVARTDAEGRYRFTTLPAGTYDLWADSEGWVNGGINQLATTAEKTTQARDLTLIKGTILRIRLVDKETGRPVELGPDTLPMLLVRPQSFPSTRPVFEKTFSPGPNGRFEVRTFPGENQINVVPARAGGGPKWFGLTTVGGATSELKASDGETINVDVPVWDISEDVAKAEAAAAVIPQLDIANKPREAAEALTQRLGDHPDDVDALLARSDAYLRLGEYEKEIADLEHVIRLNPPPSKNLIALNNLAAILCTAPDDSLRDGKRAVDLALRTLELASALAQPEFRAELLDTLAAAYAETGDFDKAIETQQKAIELDPNRESFRQHLELYRQKKPLREQRPTPTTDTAPAPNDNTFRTVDPSDTTVVEQDDHLAIGNRFLLCPVTTDGQRRLLGYVADPANDASLCVLVNYSAFKDEAFDPRSREFVALFEQLAKFAQQDRRYAKFRVLVGSYPSVPFDKTRDQAQALAKQCEALGRAAGYQRATWSTSFGGYDWKSFVATADVAARQAKSSVEVIVGDERIKVFPVRTLLSRLETDADCVVDIVPKIRMTAGSRFPDDFVDAMRQFIPQIQYERNQKMLVRVRIIEAAQEQLEKWIGDRENRLAFAKQFGFLDCAISQSLTDDGDDPPRTDPITGQVLNPDGVPAAGVAVYAHSMTNPKRLTSDNDPEPSGFHRGQTDANGRFTLRLYPAPNAVLWILPSDYSQQTHVLNDRRGDLGTFQLEHGIRMHGRVLSDDGSPLANVWVNAQLIEGPAKQELPVPLADQIQRSALTDAEGRFELGPLPPSTYAVEPGDRPVERGVPDAAPRKLSAAFLRQRVVLSAVSELDELELRAVPSLTVTIQVVDSRGRPGNGFPSFILEGEMPGEPFYSASLRFDAKGKAIKRVPRNLKDARIKIPYAALSVRHRTAVGSPWRKNLEINLDPLDGDRNVEIIRYQAPTIVIDAKDRDGKRLANAKVSAAYMKVEPIDERRAHRAAREVRFEKAPDGMWKSRELVPDEEFTLTVSAEGYKPFEEMLSLPEGKLSEINVVLIKTEAPDQSHKAASTPPQAEKGSNLLRNIRLASAPILAAMAKDHGYGLAPGQSLRRVAPPFAPIRMECYRTGHPTQAKAISSGPSAMVFRWQNDRLTNWGMTFGDPAKSGYDLIGVLDALLDIKSQQIDGPADLVMKVLPGDWVVRPGVRDTQIVSELQSILQTELDLPIRLEFREVQRPAYVARGSYKLTPLPGHTGKDETHYENKTVISDEIEIFGKQLVPNSGSGGGVGDFDEFLNWLGRWIGAPIVSEVTTRPERQITWNLHGRSPSDENTQAEDHGAQMVLANVTAQTGLTFTKEERSVRILFVERAK